MTTTLDPIAPTITPVRTAQDVLREAADWLEANPDRWLRRQTVDGQGNVCATAALTLVEGGEPHGLITVAQVIADGGRLVDEAYELCRRAAPRKWAGTLSLVAVNDNYGFHETIKFMREVADGKWG